MHPYSGGKPHFNLPGVGKGMEAFMAVAEHHARLVEIKRKYDAANVFRINQNIT